MSRACAAVMLYRRLSTTCWRRSRRTAPFNLWMGLSRRSACWCRRRGCDLWGVQDKRRSQFLAEKHGATLRVLSCRLFLLTRPAREHLGQLLGYEVRLEAALQLSSVNKKRGLIFRVGGRVSSLQRLCEDGNDVY